MICFPVTFSHEDVLPLLGELFSEVWPGREWKPLVEGYAALPLHISGLAEAEGAPLEGLGMFLLSPDLNLGCMVAAQIALYARPAFRPWGYVRLLRHVEESLVGKVAMIGGAAKCPPLGDLSPVFRRCGWTREEIVYRKDLVAGPGAVLPSEMED